jgi:hypothetical protein
MSMKVASILKLRNKKVLRLWLATLPIEISMPIAKKILRMTKGKKYILWSDETGIQVFD